LTEWTKTGTILTNNDRIYGEFLRKTGAKNVDHYGIMLFGDPMQGDFLREISMSEHVFGYGDSLSKIAYKEYGDPRYWWVIAWFNTKPTDLHCSIGDKIFAPHPLEEVLAQAAKRN
jgi:nucleoid-associated protein YgaU